MADTLGEGGFWLPSEFPYDCGSFGSSSALSSPVESVFGSTETESDEEDSLSGLTRHFARSTLQQTQQIGFNPQKTEKTWVFSGSPQSTLSEVRSWSSHGSPKGPSLSPQNEAWDFIYAACAGQVSRMKMNSDGPPKGGRLVHPPRKLTPAVAAHLSPPVENPNTGFYSHQYLGHNHSPASHFQFQQVRDEQQVLNQQCNTIWGRQAKQVLISHHNQFQNRGERVACEFQSNGSFRRPVQAEHHHHQHQNPPPTHGGSGMRAVFLGGAGVKKQCAGTGVFIPRGYGNTSDNSRKNPGCSTALIPARVVQALNKSFEDMTGQPQPQSQPCINRPLTLDYDAIPSQRKAMLAQQRRSIWPKGAINHEMVLPQEWTY